MPRTVALSAMTRTRTAKAREVGTVWLLLEMLSEAGEGRFGYPCRGILRRRS